MPPKRRIWRAAISCPGWSEGPGRDALDGGVLREEAPRQRGRSRSGAPSGAPASSGRAARASSRTAPARRRATSAGTSGARRWSGRSWPTKPPITSEWPPRYFVVEWTTMSAPSSSGRWRYGVANVLSTTHERPGGVRRLGGLADVDHVQERVRRRLEPDDARLLVQVLRKPGVDVGDGDEGEVVALRLVDLREHAVHAAVDVVHGDDAVARVDEVHDRRRRAEAGGVREPVVGAFERGEAGLESRPRRVSGRASSRSPC